MSDKKIDWPQRAKFLGYSIFFLFALAAEAFDGNLLIQSLMQFLRNKNQYSASGGISASEIAGITVTGVAAIPLVWTMLHYIQFGHLERAGEHELLNASAKPAEDAELGVLVSSPDPSSHAHSHGEDHAHAHSGGHSHENARCHTFKHIAVILVPFALFAMGASHSILGKVMSHSKTGLYGAYVLSGIAGIASGYGYYALHGHHADAPGSCWALFKKIEGPTQKSWACYLAFGIVIGHFFQGILDGHAFLGGIGINPHQLKGTIVGFIVCGILALFVTTAEGRTEIRATLIENKRGTAAKLPVHPCWRAILHVPSMIHGLLSIVGALSLFDLISHAASDKHFSQHLSLPARIGTVIVLALFLWWPNKEGVNNAMLPAFSR